MSSCGDAPLTLRGFQQHISERYEATDRARGGPKTFVWFVEEVGELATAINSADKTPGDPAVRANLAEEMADVLAWLCTLANIHDVDLDEAVRRKYLGDDRPAGVK